MPGHKAKPIIADVKHDLPSMSWAVMEVFLKKSAGAASFRKGVQVFSTIFVLLSFPITIAIANPNRMFFTGTINNKIGIQMELDFNGKELNGTYFYERYRIPVRLTGRIDANNNIELIEQDHDGEHGAHFEGKLLDGRISGNWISPDQGKIFPFSLVAAASGDVMNQTPIAPPQLEGEAQNTPSVIGQSDNAFDLSLLDRDSKVTPNLPPADMDQANFPDRPHNPNAEQAHAGDTESSSAQDQSSAPDKSTIAQNDRRQLDRQAANDSTGNESSDANISRPADPLKGQSSSSSSFVTRKDDSILASLKRFLDDLVGIVLILFVILAKLVFGGGRAKRVVRDAILNESNLDENSFGNDESTEETTSTIRPYSGSESKGWIYDGEYLRPYGGNESKSWRYDGKHLKPYGGSESKSWTFDGKHLRPYGGGDHNSWIFDGKYLRPYGGSEGDSWVFDGKNLRPYAGGSSKTWIVEGRMPIPVMAKAAGII